MEVGLFIAVYSTEEVRASWAGGQRAEESLYDPGQVTPLSYGPLTCPPHRTRAAWGTLLLWDVWWRKGGLWISAETQLW